MTDNDDSMRIVDNFQIDDGELGDMPNHHAFVLGVDYANARSWICEVSLLNIFDMNEDDLQALDERSPIVYEENLSRLKAVVKRVGARVTFSPAGIGGRYELKRAAQGGA